ncbi:hypothetical protein GCM10023188_05830 [Pontibacter saemangeumensis]|uniref:Uncharacterized protein n=1 Tax=Pontibacter saemangeumensis TaxID=1084525 RepID=A0ABP8L8Z6_9BACT
MERNDRKHDHEGGYGHENRYPSNRSGREYGDLKQQFEREYRDSHREARDSDNFYRDSGYERDDDNSRFRNYRSRDYDMERNYYENTRGDRGTLSDVRQGYGISSFGGTSDRYNTANDMQRERNAQFEQGYGTGRMSGYSGSRFGGSNYSATGDFGGSADYGAMSGSGGNQENYVSSSGYGGGFRDSGVHSDRGVPNYSTRSFGDDYGAGTGSAYGGENYGGGTGYSGGNRGGSFGNNTFGSSSGNYGGYGSMGGGTYGSGGYGSSDTLNYGRYAANADRGGYRHSDPNRDFD